MKKKIVFTYQICQTLEVWHLPQKQLNNKSSTYKNQKDPFLHLGASCLEMVNLQSKKFQPLFCAKNLCVKSSEGLVK